MTDFEIFDEWFAYDPDTGLITWKIAPTHGHVEEGDVAGTHDRNGHLRIKFHQKIYGAHRIAFLLHYGRWPNGDIDHKNGTRDDNRIANIRECTRSQNHQNRCARADSKSGLTGAYASGKRWLSKIESEGVVYCLGTYDTPMQAHAAYLAAKARLHTFNPTLRRATS